LSLTVGPLEARAGRGPDGLKARFKNLSAEVQLFNSCYNAIAPVTTGNVSEEDKINAACAKFNNDHQRDFKFVHVWEILKKLPKFMAPTKQTVKETIFLDTSEDDERKPVAHHNSYDSTLNAPETVGRDKMKRMKKEEEYKNKKEMRDQEIVTILRDSSTANNELVSAVKYMVNMDARTSIDINEDQILKTIGLLRESKNPAHQQKADELLEKLSEVQLKKLNAMF